MKYLKTLTEKTEYDKKIWFRGISTKSNNTEYTWLSKDKKLAKEYSEINSTTLGGDPIVKEYYIDFNNLNLLDLSMYDMDSIISTEEDSEDMDDFISDANIGIIDIPMSIYDYDEVSLSRLVNKVVKTILIKNDVDGFTIKENGILTMLIKSELLK